MASIPAHDHPGQPPRPGNDKNTVLVLHHFFKMMVTELEIKEATIWQVLPSFFLGWLQQHLNLNPNNPEAVCRELNVSLEAWERARQLLDSGAAVEGIWKLWPHISLGGRPAPQHQLASVQYNLVFKWTDGFVLPVSMHVLREMAGDDLLDDAKTISVIRTQMEQFLQSISINGLDGLHGSAEQFGGARAYEAMMDCYVKLKPQLDKAMVPYCDRWFSAAQLLLQPSVPPQIMSMLLQRKQQAIRQASQGGEAPPSVGGWDA